ncbi:hypothetical protein JHN63_25715 [Streptomyces sp. MBT65]|uniref:hypothetical protein n=1 Tax=Streptomyces sp. MBT65 TaxID=1488395 RepID=UPI00190CEDE0|nr:hypothetical protein [Streptomyces sp. MBT65]MBK3577137.1 hypothetical protein [Streptomyces sp. MBT65]
MSRSSGCAEAAYVRDLRLVAACLLVQAGCEVLMEGDASSLTTTEAWPPAGTTPAHLRTPEGALAELAQPLRARSGSRLVGV